MVLSLPDRASHAVMLPSVKPNTSEPLQGFLCFATESVTCPAFQNPTLVSPNPKLEDARLSWQGTEEVATVAIYSPATRFNLPNTPNPNPNPRKAPLPILKGRKAILSSQGTEEVATLAIYSPATSFNLPNTPYPNPKPCKAPIPILILTLGSPNRNPKLQDARLSCLGKEQKRSQRLRSIPQPRCIGLHQRPLKVLGRESLLGNS